MLKTLGCHFAQSEWQELTKPSSCGSQHMLVQPRLQQELAQANSSLVFYFNLAKMLWTQMNSLCKSNIVFVIFKCELQVPQ